MLIGADTGGTFTDLVDDTGRVVKVVSDRAAPDRAIAGALAQWPARPDVLCHGTTVATNALLEGELASVTLVTNEGLEDVIEIGRQDRPSLYDSSVDRPRPLVARADRHGVAGRLDAAGLEVEPLGPVPDLDRSGGPIAIVLVHSDLNDGPERSLARSLARLGRPVVCSVDVSPQFREFERTVTTVVNAGLLPVCSPYLDRLSDLADDVLVMSSAGGLLDVETAASRPAALLVSGPAAGARAAADVAEANGFVDAVSFDMGGTSTDVCLITAGEVAMRPELTVAGYPVRFDAVDIHTVGAGGGSIAAIDRGGALTVGPGSAGANPGPACYGRGGLEPTVTDADLALGRIPAGAAFGGMALDSEAASAALARRGIDPAGVVAVAETTMELAIRAVTVNRGVDPAGLALVAFGGAGGLHAVGLAEALGMEAVIVPARAGVLSAVGLITAPLVHHLVRSWPPGMDPSQLDRLRAELGGQAAARLSATTTAPVNVTTSVDCRYQGQSHELTVEGVDGFAAAHQSRNGFVIEDTEIEIVAVRARASVEPVVRPADLGIPPWRQGFRAVDGPEVIAEPDCTVWVPAGWRAGPGADGALVLERAR